MRAKVSRSDFFSAISNSIGVVDKKVVVEGLFNCLRIKDLPFSISFSSFDGSSLFEPLGDEK